MGCFFHLLVDLIRSCTLRWRLKDINYGKRSLLLSAAVCDGILHEFNYFEKIGDFAHLIDGFAVTNYLLNLADLFLLSGDLYSQVCKVLLVICCCFFCKAGYLAALDCMILYAHSAMGVCDPRWGCWYGYACSSCRQGAWQLMLSILSILKAWRTPLFVDGFKFFLISGAIFWAGGVIAFAVDALGRYVFWFLALPC